MTPFHKHHASPIAGQLLVLLTSGLLLSASGHSWASTQVAAPAKSTSRTTNLPAKVRFIESSSSESPAARSKRLKKECKGRPNAGMCLGHTQ